MNNMSSPPKSLTVRNTVCPITAKIKDNITRNECPPYKRKAPWNPVIDKYDKIKNRKLEKKIDYNVTHTYSDRANRILLFIQMFVLFP